MLRARLHHITEAEAPERHAALIEELRRTTDHSITVRRSEPPLARYTCAVHAFHLVEDRVYLRVATFGSGRTFAGSEFITFLLAHKLLTPREEDAVVPGDLILYFADGVFRHVGRMLTESRVLSKWGTGGLYEHEVWEVPCNYGDQTNYFTGPNADASLALFVKYAENQGFQHGAPDA